MPEGLLGNPFESGFQSHCSKITHSSGHAIAAGIWSTTIYFALNEM